MPKKAKKKKKPMLPTATFTLNITPEQFQKDCNIHLENCATQVEKDPVMRKLIRSMGVSPAKLAAMIRKDIV